MRYPAHEKLEIIRLVERSHLPMRRILARPGRVWNRIPDPVRERILAFAIETTELSPRELAVRFTDEEKYFI